VKRTLRQNNNEIAPNRVLTKSLLPVLSLYVNPCHAIKAVIIINIKSIILVG
tara:strand:+ start:327 stop:482 length:156 start_codon:yes stop_codon:yes gene_type:complete